MFMVVQCHGHIMIRGSIVFHSYSVGVIYTKDSQMLHPISDSVCAEERYLQNVNLDLCSLNVVITTVMVILHHPAMKAALQSLYHVTVSFQGGILTS